MLRSLMIVIAGLCLTASAVAQTQPIQWISNVNQGVSKAKRDGLPIMFYVAGSSKGDDLKDAQQAAFRDPLVGSLARARFVTIRISRSTQNKQILEQLGAPTEFGNYLLFATPRMEMIGSIPPGQVADAGTLARQMTAMFRKFRKQLFERELKPKLESKETPVNEITKALKTIEKYLILEADESVAGLLKNGGLSANVKKQVYGTLATLSTSKSVKALLEAAPSDKLAQRSLGRCTPGGAEELLPALDSENDDEFVIAYEAMVKICKLGKKKSRGFWNGKNERLIYDELDRVDQGVRKASQRWKEKYEAYR